MPLATLTAALSTLPRRPRPLAAVAAFAPLLATAAFLPPCPPLSLPCSPLPPFLPPCPPLSLPCSPLPPLRPLLPVSAAAALPACLLAPRRRSALPRSPDHHPLRVALRPASAVRFAPTLASPRGCVALRSLRLRYSAAPFWLGQFNYSNRSLVHAACSPCARYACVARTPHFNSLAYLIIYK